MKNTELIKMEIENIIDAEYRDGHFNGSIIVMKDDNIVSKISRGYANIQFAVHITSETRFPIASISKLFTSVLLLQSFEKSLLSLEDKICEYIDGLPNDCKGISVLDLLTHYSGLKNEPIHSFDEKNSIDNYIKNFLVKNENLSDSCFNYNNIDYIIITKILELVHNKLYEDILKENIFEPLNMLDSGMVDESKVISRLSYGYCNYTFGSGNSNNTIANNPLIYLSNYSGAGAIYSTTNDLGIFMKSIKNGDLLSSQISSLLIMPQRDDFIEYARGCPTIGFYYNSKSFSNPVLERRGSIGGFNSVIMTNINFDTVIIILANTDTSDMEKLGDKIYKLLEDGISSV